MRLLLATTNLGKVAEVEQILQGTGIEVTNLGEEIPEDRISDELEIGTTFEENALLKARYYHRVSGLPTVAEDSGLEVEALDGRPGVLSARYAGRNAGDDDRIERLLAELNGVAQERRRARFVCAAALVGSEGGKVFRGEVDGLILTEPRGIAGFGYDPVFYYPPFDKSFAEMSMSEKSRVSHRGQAFRQLAEWFGYSAGARDSSTPHRKTADQVLVGESRNA